MTQPVVRPLEAEPSRVAPPSLFIGDNHLHHVSEQLGASKLEVNGIYYAPGARSRPHTHDTDQLIYVIEGEAVIAVAGSEDQVVEAGQFVMLPADVPHMHGATDAGTSTHISIMPSGHNDGFDCAIPASWDVWRQ